MVVGSMRHWGLGSPARGAGLGLVLVLAGRPAWALPAAQKCQAAKNHESGKYSACLQKAQGELARTPGSCSLTPATECYADSACGPGETCSKSLAKFQATVSRCADKFAAKWLGFEQKAGGACPDGLLADDVRQALEARAEDIAAGLAGGGLRSCAGSAANRNVLMIVANDGFYYQEYAHPRALLEAGGFEVTVAAGRAETAVPHWGTGQPPGLDGSLTPDLTLAAVDPNDFAALVIVGGWGASSYQFAFEGSIDNPAWRADPPIAARANELIGEFLAAGKYVMGICHGVSVLAWARVGGVSPLAGKNVVASDIGSPAQTYNGVHYNDYELASSQMVADNGAIVAPANSIGNPATPADDVVVDGRIVTVQNQHAALQGGLRLVELLRAEAE